MFVTTRQLLLIAVLISLSRASSFWGRTKQDCGVSVWSDFTLSPDGLTRTRTRKIFLHPQNGGAPCPALTETETNVWSPKRPTTTLVSSRSVTDGTYLRRRRQITAILPRDMLFIIDMSGSLGSSNFELAKTNVAALIEKFCGSVGEGYGDNRVAVIFFGSTSVVKYRFSDVMDLQTVQAAITSMAYEAGGTYLHTALEQAIELFKTDTGIRSDTESVKEVVILTDGVWCCVPDDTIYKLVGDLSAVYRPTGGQAVAVYAFLIGRPDPNYQTKFDKLVTGPLPHHLFVFVNMKFFDDAVKLISTFNANGQPGCVPLEIQQFK